MDGRRVVLEIVMPREDLAPQHRETAPLLKAWTSYYPYEFQTTVSMRPAREDFGTHVASVFSGTVSVPFPSGKVPLHSSIYLQLLVHSPNSRDVSCERPDGTARLHLQPLVESHHRGDKISLPVQTRDVVDDRGRPFTKTQFLVKETTFLPELDGGDPGVSFDPLRPYDVHFLNGSFMDRLLQVAVGADMFPFVRDPEAWKSLGPPLQPSDPHTGNLHFPVWVTESVNLPGPFFWTIEQGPVPDERIVLHHLRIALRRAAFDEERFNRTVEGQMERTGDEYDPVFTECCSLAMDAAMVWATAMPYIADKLYGRKNDGTGWADVPVENFGWGTRANDCDGLARQIYRMAVTIRDGDFSHRTTKNLQKIHRLYVTFGMLGSVSAPKVEDSSANSSLPIGREFGAEAFGAATGTGTGTRFGNAIVDSEEDRKAPRGGHAWVEALPLARFLKMVSRCEGEAGERNPSAEEQAERYVPGSLRPEGLADWNEKMPHLLGEGTGRMHPLQLPPGEYADGDEELRESYEEGRKGYLRAARGAFSALEDVMGEAKASMRQYQTMLRDVPDTRLSRFYVKAIHAYTDRFMHKDSAWTCWFTWMNTSPRVPDADEEDELSVLRAELSAPAPRTGRRGPKGTHREWWEHLTGTKKKKKRDVSGWNYGCNLRDRLHGTSGRSYVGLMAHPPYGKAVLKMGRAAQRHLPPDVPLKLPARMEPGEDGELPEHLMLFNEGAATWKELDSASKERWEGKTPERILFFAPLSYVTPSVAGRLSEVVRNSKNISGARAVREVVIADADADLVRFEIDWITDSDGAGRRGAYSMDIGAFSIPFDISTDGVAALKENVKLFDKFHQENSTIDKLEVKRTYDINHENMLGWLDAVRSGGSPDAIVKFATTFAKNLRHVSFSEFRRDLYRTCFEIRQRIFDERPHAVVFFISGDITKSNTWIALLVWQYFKKLVTHLTDDIEKVPKELSRGKKRVFLLHPDDMSYSGLQMAADVNATLGWSADLTYFPVVGLMGAAAVKQLETLTPAFTIPKTVEIVPRLEQLLRDDYGAESASEILDELKRPPWWDYYGVLRNTTLIYFDHKLADRVSIATKMLVDAVAQGRSGHRLKKFRLIRNCEDAIYKTHDGRLVKPETQWVDLADEYTCPKAFYKTLVYTFDGKPLEKGLTVLQNIRSLLARSSGEMAVREFENDRVPH